jgi:hypothetical protein
MDLATRQVQVLGDLAAGLAGTDHQNRAVRKPARTAVCGGVGLLDPLGQPPGQRRNRRRVIRAGGHHDLVGGEVPGARAELEHPAGAPTHPRDAHPLRQRRPEVRRIVLEVADYLVADHEAVRISALIGVAGELALPVRRNQAERVPTPYLPLVSDLVRLDDDVLHAALSQAVAQ